MKLYRTIIRPVLNYGCPLCSSATSTRLNRLNTIQNTALRIATGAFRTTPTPSLLCEASECPLAIRRQYLSTISFLNIKANPTFNSKLHHIIRIETISKDFGIL